METITRNQFRAFDLIRKSGVTNMFYTDRVAQIAEEKYEAVLTRKDILNIMDNYDELSKMYK